MQQGLDPVYIPCKHFKVFLQIFYGNEVNSIEPIKMKKKISGIERLVLPFPDT